MKIRLAAPVTKDSIVDGPGLRIVIWTQGCLHNCKNCHNPQTHSFDGGFEIEIDEIIKQIEFFKLQQGVTFSGGDPLEQAEACAAIAKAAKEKGLNIWVYTGYVFERILTEADHARPDWKKRRIFS